MSNTTTVAATAAAYSEATDRLARLNASVATYEARLAAACRERDAMRAHVALARHQLVEVLAASDVATAQEDAA